MPKSLAKLYTLLVEVEDEEDEEEEDARMPELNGGFKFDTIASKESGFNKVAFETDLLAL